MSTALQSPPTGTGTPPRVVRFFPEIRSAHLERDAAMVPGTYLYTATRTDFDPTVPVDPARWRHVSPGSLLWHGLALRADVLEIPEPLWLRVAPQSAALLAGVRARDRMSGRRTTVVTYAIENATLDRRPRRLARLPGRAWRSLATVIAGTTLGRVDRIVFGTPAARTAYLQVARTHRDRALVGSAPVVPALPVTCRCGAGRPGSGRILFLGALEPRKGIDLLLAAWPLARAADARLSLLVMGTGPLESRVRRAADDDPSISFAHGGDRRAVHAALCRSAVVVLPSQPDGRWREQVGLPIVEALAHGCSVVTTTETGLAAWLASHGHRVLDVPTDPAGLAQAVADAAATLPPTDPSSVLPSVDGRCAADAVLVGSTTRAPDPAPRDRVRSR